MAYLNEQSVLTALAGLGVASDRQDLFAYANCAKVVDFCQANEIALLGMEGFELVGDGILPDSEHIADYSEVFREYDEWSRIVELTCNSARNYFRDHALAKLHYEFVFGFEHEWTTRPRAPFYVQ